MMILVYLINNPDIVFILPLDDGYQVFVDIQVNEGPTLEFVEFNEVTMSLESPDKYRTNVCKDYKEMERLCEEEVGFPKGKYYNVKLPRQVNYKPDVKRIRAYRK